MQTEPPPPIAAHAWLAALRSFLFDTGQPVWAVVDGDNCPQLLPMVNEWKVEHANLMGARFGAVEQRRSPHLVRVLPSTPFSDWLLGGWGRAWGIYAVSSAPLRQLRDHFRSFLVVANPAGSPLFFRYFDPRVFGVYLPTVNTDEAAAVFGPVDSYLFEEELSAAVLRFSRRQGGVRVDQLGRPE